VDRRGVDVRGGMGTIGVVSEYGWRLTMSAAELWLVRHGETVGGSSTRLYGSTDLALSAVGRRQMECVRSAVGDRVFDRVITSPLQRSREAAAIVHPRPQPAPEVIDAFTEIDFGDWEGLTADEVAARYPHEVGSWRSAAGDWGFPGGETRNGFRARVAEGIHAHLSGASGRSLLVLHKGVVKIIIGTLLDETPELYATRACELGSLHVLARENGSWRSVTAAVDHLGEHRQPGSR
jgi:broad specificity phosphatase PhoE